MEITKQNYLSIQEVRQILGTKYAYLSDQEIEVIKVHFEMLARIAINSFKNKLHIEKLQQECDNKENQ